MIPAMKGGLERDTDRSIDCWLMLIHHPLPLVFQNLATRSAAEEFL